MEITANTSNKIHNSEGREGKRWRENCTTNQPPGNKTESESKPANCSRTFWARLYNLHRGLC